MQRAEHTLEWLPKSDEFRQWESGDVDKRAQTLWIKGPPGVGKSVLAGSVIDLLRSRNPNSTVAYFFCKGDHKGLTTARDIIQTFAYQCSAESGPRSALEKLRKNGFRVEDTIDVNLLFQKLLEEPLHHVGQETFIVLDGLDEADYETMAKVELQRREIDILVERLSALPRCRLLLLSRPPADVLKIVPHAITKYLGGSDSQNDIERFVSNYITSSERLQTQFKRRGIDAGEYFVSRSKGIFLWVDLALQALSAAKTESDFDTTLDGFSRMSGSMDKLYSSVFSRLNSNDQKWAKEVLQWVIVGKVDRLQELQASVEQSLQTEPRDFKNFLEIECGSFLRVVSLDPGKCAFVCVSKPRETVQLIHETLRSFLMDSTRRGQEFFIDEEASHAYLASVCLNAISETEDCNFVGSASWRWADYLRQSQRVGNLSDRLLVSLHRFFTSKGLKTWLKHLYRRDPHVKQEGLNISVEERPLNDVCIWLKESNTVGPVNDDNTALEMAVKWRQSVLDGSQDLSELIGKTAAATWLYDTLDSFEQAATNFLLAQKYWKRYRKSRGYALEIPDLIADEFGHIRAWADWEAHDLVKHKNLGVAYFLLQNWDNAIRYLSVEKNTADCGFMVWEYLGDAYNAQGDFNNAINSYQTALERDPTNFHLRNEIGHLYMARKDYDNAIKSFLEEIENDAPRYRLWGDLGDAYKAKGNNAEALKGYLKGIEEAPEDWFNWMDVGKMYRAEKDHEGEIKTYESAIEKIPTNSLMWSHLYEAYVAKGDHSEAVRTYARAIELNPNEEWGWMGLAKEAQLKGEYDQAIELNGKAIGLSPTCWWLWKDLSEIYRLKGDFEGRIRTYETALKIHPTQRDLWMSLVEVYSERKETAMEVHICERALESNKSSSWSWRCLADTHKRIGAYHRAIEAYEMAINLNPISVWSWMDLASLYQACGNYDQAITTSQVAVLSAGSSYLLHKTLGDIHKENEKWDCAINSYTLALQKAPSPCFLFIYIDIGQSQFWQPDIKTAATTQDSGLRAFPWISIGEAYEGNGAYDEAMKIYEDAIRIYKEALESPHNGLRWLYPWRDAPEYGYGLSLGDAAALERDLPTTMLWIVLGEAYKANRELGSAINAFQKALNEAPGHPWLTKALEDLCAVEGEQRRAEASLEVLAND